MSETNSRLTVIFDFDGTLANTLELIVRIYNEHHEEFGSLPAELKDLPKYQKLGYKKGAKQLRIRWHKVPKMIVTILREMREHMDEVEPFIGVVEMLEELKQRGISVGVLTSNSHQLVQDYFEANNFPEFDFVVSEKTMFSKEKALRRIIRRYGLDTSRVLYVGDEPRDVSSCHKAGIRVVGVSWGLGGVPGLTPSKPDRIVHTTEELHKYIINVDKELSDDTGD